MWLENDQNWRSPSRILLFTILLFFCIFHYLQSLGYFCIIWKFPPFFFMDIIERENSRPITNWHVTLPSPQDIANYKTPRIATRLCYHYLETNRNLPSVMQKKKNHTSARVSDDTSSSARVSDGTSSPVRISGDIGGSIKLWHVSPIRLRHVSLTHPQTPINRSIRKAFGGQGIQKYKSSARIKPQSLQELQPRNRRTLEAESSKLSA